MTRGPDVVVDLTCGIWGTGVLPLGMSESNVKPHSLLNMLTLLHKNPSLTHKSLLSLSLLSLDLQPVIDP